MYCSLDSGSASPPCEDGSGPAGWGGAGRACGPRARALCPRSVARAARGRTSLLALRPRRRSPLCRTTRPLGATRGPRARPASLLLLAAWLAAVATELACPQEPPAAQLACASCRFENPREHSLRVIRESLLAKLGFAQAPNTTGRQLPRVPDDLMEMFALRPPPPGVLADAPGRTIVTHTEPDDFLARTDNVLIFGRAKFQITQNEEWVYLNLHLPAPNDIIYKKIAPADRTKTTLLQVICGV